MKAGPAAPGLEQPGRGDPDPEASDQRQPARSWRGWYVPLVVAGAAAFCLGPSLVGARILISVDSLTNFLPWSVAGNEGVGHQLCQSDTIDSVLPSAAYIRRQVYSGHLASWQSLQSGGGPLGSLPNAGMLDPLSLPYWVLPLRWAPAFVILLTWVAAIGGTFLFLRRLSVGRPAATLAGFVFATSGFMVMWSNWPQARTAALIPALFWATERVATRAGPLDAALVALVVASMLFGGFPQVTGFALYMAGAYFVVRVAYRYRRAWRPALRSAGLAVGGLAAGLGLSAVQMLPFLDFYSSHDFSYRSALNGQGLPLSGLQTLVAPDTNGLCLIGQPLHGTTDPVELVAYVGAAAVVLAISGAAFGLAGRRRIQAGARGFLLASVVVAGLVCWVSPGARSAVSSLPVFSGNFLGRIRSVMDFGLAALAGFGFDWVTTHRAGELAGRGLSREARELLRLRRLRRLGRQGRSGSSGRWAWPVFVAAEAVIFGLGVMRTGDQDAADGHYLGSWWDAVRVPLILVAVTAAIVVGVAVLARLAAAGRPGGPVGVARDLAFLVLPVLVVAQGSQFFHTVMPGDDPRAFYPATGDHQFLAAHLGADRFASANLTLYPATAFYYGLRSATGHQFNDTRWNRLLTTVDPHVMSGPTQSNFSGDINSGDISRQPLLDLIGVRYFVLPPTDVAGAPARMAPANGALSTASGPATCAIPGGPMRGVQVVLAQPLDAARPFGGVTLHLTVLGAGVERTSGVYLAGDTKAGSTVTIPIAGEDLPAGGTLEAGLTVAGSSTPLVLDATRGTVDCAPLRPISDGLKLVYADAGAVIYQRTTALPRIRWVAASQVVTDPQKQLDEMEAGQAASTVLLSAPGPAGSGEPAEVSLGEDSGDRITASVRATGGGYVMVADPMQVPGWTARLDGRPVPLRAADYTMVAVWVPAGTHTVSFTYTAPGQIAGAWITAVALVIVVAMLVADFSGFGTDPRRHRPAHARRGRM